VSPEQKLRETSQICDLYSISISNSVVLIFMLILKSRWMRWAGCRMHEEYRNVYRVSVGKPEGKMSVEDLDVGG
jgi:hypothetical protein